MKLVEFSPDRVRHIARNMRADDRAEVHATRWDDDDDRLAAEVCAYPTKLRWVACHGDEPVAVIGAVNMWPGNFSVFMFATDNIQHIGLSLTRFAKYRMIPTLLDMGGWRGEARSAAFHTEAHRWLEALGARRESTLANYGKNGEDFYNYVWTRPDVS
ncbi:hypothetical protein T8K17_11215 [Thalassobaculum sp. OXR-137]|uniref:hypothetical protein n=1 Tax=Thalassobaculum sp. OXR-137 TaxID=3100173 RepID=UPI002AC9AF32|nr:hypothetical protein [Thalassobaculum sp. OXR-137]WPZ36704.1 hypothetical protein T8K17_11215 [Thalassobaculum sp. OXR-137]